MQQFRPAEAVVLQERDHLVVEGRSQILLGGDRLTVAQQVGVADLVVGFEMARDAGVEGLEERGQVQGADGSGRPRPGPGPRAGRRSGGEPRRPGG
ncbi:hypothetical protein [Streptomyces lydicus]|uniref:hypothetical protein n=1 Tax=Streptomyces lydicus TaxID=47763 RepID=UPI0036F6DEDB